VEACKKNLKNICNQKIYKVLLRADTPEDALLGVKAVNALNLHGYIAVRSWDLSLEIVKRENAKGAALKRLAAANGSRITVAVGDYENDIDMLEASDIGYAVENACDSLKAVANRTTSHAKCGALADVICEIERELCSE
jgi:hydroxymethylpyrimidine pyrophosphatase-like HAD family hydrolase